jgi:hypothetical protein
MWNKFQKLGLASHAALLKQTNQTVLLGDLMNRSYSIQPQDRLKIVYKDFNWPEYHKSIP